MTPTTRRTAAPKPAVSTANSVPGNSVPDFINNGGGLDSILTMGESMADVKSAAGQTRRAAVRNVEDIAQKLESQGIQQREGVREKILSADLQFVQELAKTEESDFAQALEALQQVAANMDVQFKQLVEPTPEELAIVASAQNKVADLKTRIADTQKRWNIFGLRDRALFKLQAELTTANQKVTESEAQVQQLMRQRLMAARLDASIETYVGVSNKTVQIMVERVKEVSGQILALRNRLTDAGVQKGEAVKMLDQLNADLTSKELELRTKEEELIGLVNGTPQHTAKEKEISDVRIEVEGIRGNRDVALTQFQSKEIFVQRLEGSLLTMMKLRDRHKARIARLTSDTQERVATYKARLVTMKVMADQKFDELIDQIGREFDRNTDEYMASAMVAADNALLNSLEQQPDKLKALAEVQNAMAEHIAKTRERGEKILRDMRDRYGIDPKGTSFFSYESPGDGAALADPTH